LTLYVGSISTLLIIFEPLDDVAEKMYEPDVGFISFVNEYENCRASLMKSLSVVRVCLKAIRLFLAGTRGYVFDERSVFDPE
jgi:hypothetical protein